MYKYGNTSSRNVRTFNAARLISRDCRAFFRVATTIGWRNSNDRECIVKFALNTFKVALYTVARRLVCYTAVRV